MHEHELLIQAAIYLAAAVIVLPLSRKLGLGAVLGYLVAGVAIGPGGIGLIRRPEVVLQFSEFGIVLLLFAVGLELEPRRLWGMRKAILGLGGLQVLLTTLAAAVGCRLLLPAISEYRPGWIEALIIGMGVAMSSTAISLQVLGERDRAHSPAGEGAFAVALFQDLAIVPMLLILKLLVPMKLLVPSASAPLTTADPRGRAEATSHDPIDVAQQAVSAIHIDPRHALTAIAVVVGMVFIGRLLLRPWLRMIAGTGMRELFMASALLLVIGSALATMSVGVSMAMGAFIAGLLLADSEYRMALEADIEPFKGLLLGLFFIAVGMSIDTRLMLREPVLILAMAGSWIVTKMAILGVLGKAFGFRRVDRSVIALSLSQVGEFAFVLWSAAGASRLIDAQLSQRLTAAVAVSMLTTPLLFLVFERWVFPRFERRHGPRAPDRFRAQHRIIIAGMGRFGQVVARVLQGKGYQTTIIDQDPGQVDLIRGFGWRAYYGDVSRPEVLESAGADKASLLVLAIDDSEAALRTIRHVRVQYPNLKVVARARGRRDAFDLLAEGIVPVRETYGSALEASALALERLGMPAYEARRTVHLFRQHDEYALLNALPDRDDRDKLIARTAESAEMLRKLLQDDLTHRRMADGHMDWDEPITRMDETVSRTDGFVTPMGESATRSDEVTAQIEELDAASSK